MNANFNNYDIVHITHVHDRAEKSCTLDDMAYSTAFFIKIMRIRKIQSKENLAHLAQLLEFLGAD